MSDNPRYTMDLVRASDLATIVASKFLPARSRVFKPIFNKPGTLEWVLPLDSDAAKLVKNRATGIILSRDERPIWSGGLTSVIHSGTAETTSCVATGWLEELDHRFVRKSEEPTLSFPTPGVPGGQIIQTLMATCNAQQDTASITRPVRARFGQALDTQVRTRSYKVGDNYGSSIRELIEIEDGCDVLIDPITRLVTTRDPAAFVVRSAHLGYGVFPHNLDDAVVAMDGTSISNRENAVSSGGVVVSVDDQVAIDDAGVMLEEWLSLSDVADTTIVSAYANAELVYKRYGQITYTLTPKPYGDLPRPYDDFEWGDQLYFSAKKGAIQIDYQAVRMFGATINITDGGDEVVSELQVTAS